MSKRDELEDRIASLEIDYDEATCGHDTAEEAASRTFAAKESALKKLQEAQRQLQALDEEAAGKEVGQ